MIRKIDENLWVLDSHFVALGCKGSIRMTIVKTAQGLLLHSPVDLSPADIKDIDALGEVKHIIAPNLFHHMHFATCAKHFPSATCWTAQGLAEKVKNLPLHKILNASTPIFDSDDISQIEIYGHKLKETVFFHHATSTLITADFLYNYQAEQYWAEKIFFWLLLCYGRVAIPFYHYLAIEDTVSFNTSLLKILDLPTKRIIMSHGRIVEHANASYIFEAAWKRVLRRHI